MIDHMKRDLTEFSGSLNRLPRIIYVAGAPKQTTISKDYIGCLRNITFKSHKLYLNLIDLAISGHNQITFIGHMIPSCQQITHPITFNSPDSFIPINTWPQYPRIKSFSIDFQTTENFGVLAYMLGHKKFSFFSLEIHNRLLNAYFKFGESFEYVRFEVVNEDVSNGKPHQLRVEVNENNFVTFKFDQKQEKTLNIERPNEVLNLTGDLIIGGRDIYIIYNLDLFI